MAKKKTAYAKTTQVRKAVLSATATCDAIERTEMDGKCYVTLVIDLPPEIVVPGLGSDELAATNLSRNTVDAEFVAPVGMFEFCGQYVIEIRKV